MQCDHNYLPLLSGHLDGTNSETEEKRLQKHLKSCKHCRELLEIMEQNDALLSQSSVQPPADLTARIMDAVRKEPKKTGKRKRFYFSTAAAGLAAAAMLCFAFMGDNLPLLSKGEDNAGAELKVYSAPVSDPGAAGSILEDENYSLPSDGTENEAEDTVTGTLSDGSVEINPTESTAPSAYAASSEYTPQTAPSVQTPEIAPPTQPSESEAIPSNTQEDVPDEVREPFTLPTLDGDISTHSTEESTDTAVYRNPIYGKDAPSAPVPTLVIWGVSAEDIRLPFGAVKTDFSTQSTNSVKTSLYDHFASALFTLRQPIVENESENLFLKPAIDSELYRVTYNELCDLFDSCAGKYELALYFPRNITDLEECQIILINVPQTTAKSSDKFSRE